MLRSIIPFVLVCLGFAVVGLARDMPLFEWEISKMTADLPPDFHVKPSPWTTRLGDFTTWYGKPLDHSTSFLWQVYTPSLLYYIEAKLVIQGLKANIILFSLSSLS